MDISEGSGLASEHDIADHPLVCVVDELYSNKIRGWAIDARAPHVPANLHVLIDGEEVAQVRCDQPRDDVASATSFNRLCGFEVTLPQRYSDNREHTFEIRDSYDGVQQISFTMKGFKRSSLQFKGVQIPNTLSMVDGIEDGTVKGWVLVQDVGTGGFTGGCTVRLTVNGEPVADAKANLWRPDVGKEHNADAYCGFRIGVPYPFSKSRPQPFRVTLLPYELELTGSPLVASVTTEPQKAQLLQILETVDELRNTITELRQVVSNLIPKPTYNLDNYHEWAPLYLQALAGNRDRWFDASRRQPLVSILCPTYKPDLAHFVSAIESVIAQTYRNWELIIVDDGSQSPELSKQISSFEHRDERIRSVRRARNGGISRATNSALEAARGAWVLLFDHDDLLVDVALELMVSSALAAGAQVVYADEDKIDASSKFCEPALKPDFNYRLLLTNNYICHPLMIARSALRKAGRLDPAHDGAQDHDILLRLAEVVEHDRFLHVPHVLYHWRKTDKSTASSIESKSFAVKAGQAAVSNHLLRRGLPVEVNSVLGATFYSQRWKFARRPKVTVIIPFRDQARMTSECMQNILQTDYDNYDVILVDNWSTSLEALELSRSLSSMPRCRVLRVEEPFNFSRLNNLAAAEAADAEFLVLMNNDVFHPDRGWLEKLVGEALSDEKVAVVGARLAYPNGTIQHAGILLGMGGIAGHAHSDRALDDPGYCGRLAVAQEMSAVTAACMLVRSSVFREVSGFDEDALAVAFNDVDFCLRVRAAGYKVIWTPDVLAEHRESTSRGADDLSGKRLRFINECSFMEARWGDRLRSDPYYNPLFDMDGQPFFDLIDPASASPVTIAPWNNRQGITGRMKRERRVTREKEAREN